MKESPRTDKCVTNLTNFPHDALFSSFNTKFTKKKKSLNYHWPNPLKTWTQTSELQGDRAFNSFPEHSCSNLNQ